MGQSLLSIISYTTFRVHKNILKEFQRVLFWGINSSCKRDVTNSYIRCSERLIFVGCHALHMFKWHGVAVDVGLTRPQPW